MVEEENKTLIRQWTLANALEHGGTANTNAVIGKLIAEKPELKSKIKELKENIEKSVKEINRLSVKEQESELERLGSPERIEKEKKEGLSELPERDKYENIVTRFAPNPNGPLHLGHVRTAVLSHEYAVRNNGKFILRFEDTNPENAKEDMYDFIRNDLKWLEITWDEEYIQSQRMEIYYQYIEQLLEEGKAYICTCPPNKFKKLRDRKNACPCRGTSKKENLSKWEKMLGGSFKEKEAVGRIKTDLKNPNPALRDWPAFRIVSKTHPKTGDKYRVWPLYNFSVAIDDYKMGITHVLRGKEHEVNEQRQRQLFEHLGWKYPTALQHGRLAVTETVLSKTKIMNGIRERIYEGYDDVRLGTVAAMRRRGIVPQALRDVVIDIGITKTDSTLSWDTLYSKNRKIIDEKANRYFFVPQPERLLIKNVPDKKEARLRLHPDREERGKRTLPLERDDGKLIVWISKKDVDKMGLGDIVRLKDLLNFELTSIKPLEANFKSFELLDVPKIQWVSKNPIEVEVLEPTGDKKKGYAEPEVKNLSKGEIIQFERYGFISIDEIEPKVRGVYTHS